jgi:hypothetical protein
MVLDKLFGMVSRLFGEHDNARPDAPVDPVRARLQKLRKAKGGPDFPTNDLMEKAETDSSVLPETQARMRKEGASSGGFPRQEPPTLPQFVSRRSKELDAAPPQAQDRTGTDHEMTDLTDLASNPVMVPEADSSPQSLAVPTEQATSAPQFTGDMATATANAHKRRLFDTKTLLALRIKQELARSQEIARIKELARTDQRLGKRFEPKRNLDQAQTMKLEALERTNLLSDEDRAKLRQKSKQDKTHQLFGLDAAPMRTTNASDLVFVEPLTLSPIDTSAVPNEVADSSDGKILAKEWDIQPDLTLTADGLLQESLDAQAKLRGVENQGVDDLFSEFDTTANLPGRSSPFEKFSESSLKVLAGNPRTPARILSWLASHLNPEIRALVSRNRSALPETIWLLAKDYDESVRLAIAEYLEADRAILKMLSNDTSPLVAWRAKNSLYLLKAGARTGTNMAQMPQGLHTPDASKRSPNPFKNLVPGRSEPEVNEEELNFLKVIAQKTSTPTRRLADLAKHANKEIRALVAENANASLETLWYLSKDSAAEVKLKLTENYNCPIEIIEALQEDKDSFVSWQARNILIKLMGQPTAPISLTEEQMRTPLVHSH